MAMTFTATFFDDDESWRAYRRLGVGAADVASIVGLPGAYGSPYSVWVDKVGLVGDDDPSDEMQFGRDAEMMLPVVCPRETGLHVIAPQVAVESVERPWMRATLDGLLADGPNSAIEDAVAILEMKTTGPSKAFDEIPDAWQAQSQWQMAVTDLDRVVFLVLHGRKWRTYTIDRNEDDIAWLTQVVEAFWFENVVAGVAPDVDGHPATSHALNHRWQARDDETVDLDHETYSALIQLLNEKAHAKASERRQAELENIIKAKLEEATAGLVDGKIAVTWRSSQSTRPDVKALQAAEPELVKKFSVTTTRRTFLAKEVK